MIDNFDRFHGFTRIDAHSTRRKYMLINRRSKSNKLTEWNRIYVSA